MLKALPFIKDGFSFKIGKGNTSFWFTPWLTKHPLHELVPFVDIHGVELQIRDVWENGNWQTQVFYTSIPHEVTQLLNQCVPCIADNVQDTWVWKGSILGTYSVKSVYRWLLNSCQDLDTNSLSWCRIWNLKLPSNIQFFLWQLCHAAIPTRVVLGSRGITTDTMCPRCGNATKTIDHCLFTCPNISQLWCALGLGDVTAPQDLDTSTVLNWILSSVDAHGVLIPTLLWIGWCARNKYIFEEDNPTVVVLANRTMSLLQSIQSAFNEDVSTTNRITRLVTWLGVVNETFMVLNVNGSADSNQERQDLGVF